MGVGQGRLDPTQKYVVLLEFYGPAELTATRQLRGALDKDPGNPQLSKMLASTQQKKLNLLLRLIRLSSQI